MKVAVLGGGPSGAFAAERLAAAGVQTVLIDEKLAWEKPCGGGLTYKAYHQYPFLIDNDTPKKVVSETILAAPKVGSVALKLRDPLIIYSRFDLNHMLLSRAEKAGAQLEKTRVTDMARLGKGWRLHTKTGSIDADYCLLATGARNPLRSAGTTLRPEDAMSALGYFVPGTQERIDIQFLDKLAGYIWVFPRAGHLSVGICGKGLPAAELRKRLERYMDEHSLQRAGSTFYSHLLPSLETPAWRQNRVAGDGWMAVGDAAGLVDPITGEGLYYAMRSADLATRTLLSDHAPDMAHDTATDTTFDKTEQAYRWLLRRDFAADLELGSRLAQRVFHGKYMFGSVPARMIQFTRRSPTFCAVIQDLFSGTQNYIGLKGRLLQNLNGSLFEILGSFGFGRLVPRKDTVA
jgi:geranylgeranyl reductase family protein